MQIIYQRVVHFDLIPIFASIIVISLLLSTLGTLIYAKYSVASNGNFSDETCFKKYWKLTEKSKKIKKNYVKNLREFEKKHKQYFLLHLFSIKIPTYRKIAFAKISYMFRDIDKKCVNGCFSRVFRQFL